MALFTVARYTGVDNENEKTSPRSKAAAILAQIHERAKQKKKRTDTPKSDISVVSSKNDLSQTSVKKKRKHKDQDKDVTDSKIRKVESNEATNRSGDNSIDDGAERSGTLVTEHVSAKKKKKEKRKSKLNDSDQKDISEIRDTVSNETIDTLESRTMNIDVDQDISSVSIDESDTKDVDMAVEFNDDEAKRNDVDNIGGFTILGGIKQKHVQKVNRVLPQWLSNPSVITADIRRDQCQLEDITGLDEALVQKLRENGITHFFPVQQQVIPALLRSSESSIPSTGDTFKTSFMIGRAGYRPNDICCSAPTGSGKTLAFVLPIIQALKHRVVPHIRALAVLPVRDLATQVYKVFKTYSEGTDLKIGLIIGQKTFDSEQTSIVKKSNHGYHSLVDILVATPGRLVDHINRTQGFSLGQLRYLVIDEADRMMDEIKQDWLKQVEDAVYQDRPRPGPLNVFSAARMEMPLQKLLFSATLSQNPEKLQQLNLFQPKLFTSVVKDAEQLNAVQESIPNDEKLDQKLDQKQSSSGEFVGKYTTPSGLTEYFVQCTTAEKPLVVLYFLHQRKFKHVLCFTNSVESTHRLYLLIKLVDGIEVREFSSSLHAVKRSRLLKQFSAGKIDLLICSDAMARGMDIEGVQFVISYDSPPYIKTYIHRVGRTARAGKVGNALTLLEKKEIHHFKKMLKDAGKTNLQEMKVKKSDLKPLVDTYQEALEQLPQILKGEKRKR